MKTSLFSSVLLCGTLLVLVALVSNVVHYASAAQTTTAEPPTEPATTANPNPEDKGAVEVTTKRVSLHLSMTPKEIESVPNFDVLFRNDIAIAADIEIQRVLMFSIEPGFTPYLRYGPSYNVITFDLCPPIDMPDASKITAQEAAESLGPQMLDGASELLIGQITTMMNAYVGLEITDGKAYRCSDGIHFGLKKDDCPVHKIKEIKLSDPVSIIGIISAVILVVFIILQVRSCMEIMEARKEGALMFNKDMMDHQRLESAASVSQMQTTPGAVGVGTTTMQYGGAVPQGTADGSYGYNNDASIPPPPPQEDAYPPTQY